MKKFKLLSFLGSEGFNPRFEVILLDLKAWSNKFSELCWQDIDLLSHKISWLLLEKDTWLSALLDFLCNYCLSLRFKPSPPVKISFIFFHQNAIFCPPLPLSRSPWWQSFGWLTKNRFSISYLTPTGYSTQSPKQREITFYLPYLLFNILLDLDLSPDLNIVCKVNCHPKRFKKTSVAEPEPIFLLVGAGSRSLIF